MLVRIRSRAAVHSGDDLGIVTDMVILHREPLLVVAFLHSFELMEPL
jgi:hypothetical protein